MSEKRLNSYFPRSVKISGDTLPVFLSGKTSPLEFVNGSSILKPELAAPLNYSDAQLLSSEMDTLESLARFHTAGCRRAENHPMELGLVAVRLPQNHVGHRSTSLRDAASLRGFGYMRSSSANDESVFFGITVPEELVNVDWAWFAPTGDVTVFGTYYIVPVGNVDGESNAYRGPRFPGIGWALCQVGIEQHVEFAAWDDAEGIAAIVNRVLNEDLETAMAIRALTDTEAVSAGLREHRYRTALNVAREVFPAHAIRPRLVPEIAESLARRESLSTAYRYSNGDNGRSPGVQTLDDYQVFGWQNRVKAVNAAYMIRFNHEEVTSDKVRHYAGLLQAALNPRRLGTVVLLSDSPHDVWVVTNMQVFSDNRAAFKIGDGVTFSPVAPIEEAALATAS